MPSPEKSGNPDSSPVRSPATTTTNVVRNLRARPTTTITIPLSLSNSCILKGNLPYQFSVFSFQFSFLTVKCAVQALFPPSNQLQFSVFDQVILTENRRLMTSSRSRLKV